MLAREDARLLVIGGGIAGASVAYFAACQGWSVTIIDAGLDRASDVPSALLDPVRGRSGQLDPRALAGLRESWALIRELEAAGHSVPHEQSGVLRAFATDLARDRASLRLPPELPHTWLSAEHSPLVLAPGWPHQLLVPGGGWVNGAGFVAALVAASGALLRQARAHAWDAGSVTLEGGEVLTAEAVVWCGGSVGASWGGGSGFGLHPEGAPEGWNHTHRGGSLLLLDRPATPLPLTAGVYFAPWLQAGEWRGVLGATFEAPHHHHSAAGPPLKSLHWLLDRATALIGSAAGPEIPGATGLWSGSRLTGERLGQQVGGWWALAGLGSKGFLLGPMLARQLVGDLTRTRTLTDRRSVFSGAAPAPRL